MSKKTTKFKCTNCGEIHTQYMGKCRYCNTFGSLKEYIDEPASVGVIDKISNEGVNRAVPMSNVKIDIKDRIITGISEVDRLFGGGFVKNSISIISAPPGTGKSTLTTIIVNTVAEKGYKVLYATGEESDDQVKGRADRLLTKMNEDNLYIVASNELEDIVASIEGIDADFVIIDSIQAVKLSHIDARQGSNKQTLECAEVLTKLAKNKNRPRCILLIGQMTKADEIKGSNELQHLVDTIIEMHGEDELKTCYSTKNRFGALEVAMFKHTDTGFEEVVNPSMYFITEREPGEEVTGSALSVIKEGTRPIVVEVESSVSKSFTPYPSRLAQGFKKDELNVMISILEQRAKINLFDKNVIISSTGGLIIRERTVNLAVLMSIASSYKKMPIDCTKVFVGEVGLTGDIKKVSSLESRIKEADRLGFSEIIIPNQDINLDLKKLKIKVKKYKNLYSLITDIFK